MSQRTLGARAGQAAALACAACVSFGVALLAARVADSDAPAEAADGQTTPTGIDATTVNRFHGHVTDRGLLSAVGVSGDTTIIVGLSAEVVITCEDLGLQLRALARSAPPSSQIVLVTDSASAQTVRTFATDEGFPFARLIQVESSNRALTTVGDPVVAPFAALVTRDGRIVRGSSHPISLGNVRPGSFVSELGLRGS